MSLEQFGHQVIEFVRVHETWAAPIVFALAFAESLAFVSLVLPSWAALVGIGRSGRVRYALYRRTEHGIDITTSRDGWLKGTVVWRNLHATDRQLRKYRRHRPDQYKCPRKQGGSQNLHFQNEVLLWS